MSLVCRRLTDALVEGEATYQLGVFDFEKFRDKAMSAIMQYVYWGLAVFCANMIAVRRLQQRFFSSHNFSHIF